MFDSLWQFVLGSMLLIFILIPFTAFMIAFMATQGHVRALVILRDKGIIKE